MAEPAADKCDHADQDSNGVCLSCGQKAGIYLISSKDVTVTQPFPGAANVYLKRSLWTQCTDLKSTVFNLAALLQDRADLLEERNSSQHDGVAKQVDTGATFQVDNVETTTGREQSHCTHEEVLGDGRCSDCGIQTDPELFVPDAIRIETSTSSETSIHIGGELQCKYSQPVVGAGLLAISLVEQERLKAKLLKAQIDINRIAAELEITDIGSMTETACELRKVAAACTSQSDADTP